MPNLQSARSLARCCLAAVLSIWLAGSFAFARTLAKELGHFEGVCISVSIGEKNVSATSDDLEIERRLSAYLAEKLSDNGILAPVDPIHGCRDQRIGRASRFSRILFELHTVEPDLRLYQSAIHMRVHWQGDDYNGYPMDIFTCRARASLDRADCELLALKGYVDQVVMPLIQATYYGPR